MFEARRVVCVASRRQRSAQGWGTRVEARRAVFARPCQWAGMQRRSSELEAPAFRRACYGVPILSPCYRSTWMRAPQRRGLAGTGQPVPTPMPTSEAADKDGASTLWRVCASVCGLTQRAGAATRIGHSRCMAEAGRVWRPSPGRHASGATRDGAPASVARRAPACVPTLSVPCLRRQGWGDPRSLRRGRACLRHGPG